jgi:hypothetical protein
MERHPLEHLTPDDIVLDAIPDDVEEAIHARNTWLNSLRDNADGLEFIVSDVRRWVPGQNVRVAFLGGSTKLHQDIVDTTKEITDACNIRLDFGLDANRGGSFRTWSTADVDHTAEIRVRFDQAGYYSLVGIDSVDANIGLPKSLTGGRPGQCSLNLGGFAVSRPENWRGVVRHEFLHALAFLHSHQNMRGPCEAAFRWEDDQGYESTKNANGAFVTDAAGRRPGIYTYLSGYPNFWNKKKVDRNLRTEEDATAVAGPFDRASVMLYRFCPLFYKCPQTDCAPSGDGISLSEGDKRGLQLLYPYGTPEIAAVIEKKGVILSMLEGEIVPEGLEARQPNRQSDFAPNLARVLRRSLRANS